MGDESNTQPFPLKYPIKDVDLNEKNLMGNVTFGHVEAHQQIISDDLMWRLNLYVNILLCGSMALFGTFNNAVNMTIFYQLGLKDSMSVFLFSLAFTDFLLSLVIVVTRSFPIWDLFFEDDERDPMAILYVGLAWVADSLFLASGWITTLLSLERCICVIFPFKVKEMFTRSRAVVGVVAVHVVTAATYVPIYLTQWLEWVPVEVPVTNGTVLKRRLVVVFSDNRRVVEYYVEILNVTLIPVPSQIIIIGSVISMVYGLVKSSKLRQSMTAQSEGKDGESQDDTLTYKTRRLAMVVLFLAMIFTICSVPRTFATYINIINPEINEGGKERNLSIFQWQFARFFSTLNASVNFFVYLTINTSYKAKFQEVFRIRSK